MTNSPKPNRPSPRAPMPSNPNTELTSDEISFPAMEAQQAAEAAAMEDLRQKKLPPSRRSLPQIDMNEEPKAVPTNYRRPKKNEVTAATITPMKSSVLWTRIVSLAGYALTAFVAVQGVRLMGRPSIPDGMSSGMFAFLGMVTIAIAFAFCAVPSFKIWQYANVIGALEGSRDEHDLNEAMDRLRDLFKYLGILVFVGIVLIGFYLFATYGSKLTGL